MWEWDNLLGSILPENTSLPAQTSPGGGTSKAGSAREQCQEKEKSSAPSCAKTIGTKVGLGTGSTRKHSAFTKRLWLSESIEWKEKGPFYCGGKDRSFRKSPHLVITPARKKRGRKIWFRAGKTFAYTTEEGLVVKQYLLYLRIVCVMCHVCVYNLYSWRNTKNWLWSESANIYS